VASRINTGNALPFDDDEIGQDFQSYYPRWQALLDSFTDFCTESSSEFQNIVRKQDTYDYTASAMRQQLSLQNLRVIKGEAVVDDEVEDKEDGSMGLIDKPEADSGTCTITSQEITGISARDTEITSPASTGQSRTFQNVPLEHAQPPIDPELLTPPVVPANCSSKKKQKQLSPVAGGKTFTNYIQINGTSIGYNPPHVGDNLTEQQQSENSRALGLAVKDVPGIEDIIMGMRIENAALRSVSSDSDKTLTYDNSPTASKITQQTTTALRPALDAAVAALVPASPKLIFSNLTNQELSPLSSLDGGEFPGTQAAKPVSVRRSARQVPTEKENEVIGAWTKDAAAYLNDVFKKNPFGSNIVTGFLAMEALMGYPTGKVSTRILPLLSADVYDIGRQGIIRSR
jgi:hypothetical protein